MGEAKLKAQVYKDSRPAEYFTTFHKRTRQGIRPWMYAFVRMVLTPPTILLYRLRAIKVSNVPASGACIVTPNHFSTMDHFFAAVCLRRQVQFMAKSQLFGNPILNTIFSFGGVFPVRRGHKDDEAIKTANTVLDRGGAVLMYAEGGRSRSRELGEPKRGVGKLALDNGVPVVPVAIHGSDAVRGWKRLDFPKVTVQYGEPIPFPKVENPTAEQQQEAAEKIFNEVRKLYVALEEQGRRGVLRSLREAATDAATAPVEPHSS